MALVRSASMMRVLFIAKTADSTKPAIFVAEE
jgi:hypothetical protein